MTSDSSPNSGIFPRVVRPASLDWVKFDAELARDGSVDPVDKALYAALASFVDADDRDSDPDPDGGDVPTRLRLAQCIGRSVDTVDRVTKRLEDRGLVRVHRRRDPDNPKSHLPSVYELLDHERWDERAAARAKARREARGSRTDAARGSRMDAAVPLLIEKRKETPPTSAPSVTPDTPVAELEEGGEGGFPREQKSKVVGEVRALRPEWTASSIAKALDKAVAEREDPALVREAMLLVARDRESQSPGRLAFDGPWWAKAAASLRAPSSGGIALPPRCDDSQHDPDAPNDRRLYSEDGKPRRCPRCHPHALAQGVAK